MNGLKVTKIFATRVYIIILRTKKTDLLKDRHCVMMENRDSGELLKEHEPTADE